MKNTIYELLQTSSADLSVTAIVLGLLASLVIGLIIFVSYRFSHASAVYSAKFNVSLVMLTLVTTLVMTVIGNNIALSLGMVGALSIVRFRTAIKDPRDTAYIFWCIAAGICCGVQDFTVAGLGSGLIFVVMLVLGNVKGNERYLLIVRGKNDMCESVRTFVKSFYQEKAMLRVENTTRDEAEQIYEISARSIKKSAQSGRDISKELYEIDRVESVNLVCQNDEINR